jgi:hypothetical protein
MVCRLSSKRIKKIGKFLKVSAAVAPCLCGPLAIDPEGSKVGENRAVSRTKVGADCRLERLQMGAESG